MTTPTDPLYANQWHFSLIGNIEAIWADYIGTGVSVGIYDDGIDYLHADLDDNYDASLQVLDDLGNVIDPFPSLSTDGHGTAVAGLIGAEANGVGGVGVAYGVQITSINIFGASVFGYVNGDTADFLFVVQQADNFDISSNSWGAYPGFFFGLGLLDGGFSQQLTDVYSDLSGSGRGGLGTIFVQAAGNDNEDANGDGINASRFTITVAATDFAGFAAYYSQYGANILITAPAASVTTDVTGANGYDAGDYTSGFGGTSAATPVVSGVVALMLDANAGLGWRDVQNILAMSATLTGSAFNAALADVEEEGLWQVNAGSTWNGGGAHIHTNYGYGMLNAYNAVRMAEVWSLFGPAQTSANDIVTSNLNDFADTVVPDGTGVAFSTTISISGDVEIDHVALRLNFDATYVGDLRIVLTSAEGTQIVVQDDQNNAMTYSHSGEWQFGIDGLRGELAAGTWTVQVFDQVAGGALTVRSARLDVYGAEASENDVYHFTDEFLTMMNFDFNRAFLEDTNGGTDWLNFAAVTGDIALDLNFLGNLFVDGNFWATSFSDFENAVTGDGNDTVAGNMLGNTVHLMRGNDVFNGVIASGNDHDTVYGGAGGDTLDGAGGNDVLDGGTDADRLTGGTGNDTISGGAGLDTLTGGTGIDSLTGGTDSDWYYVDNAADIIVEAAGGGTADRVLAAVNFTLAADDDVEQLTTTAFASVYAVDLTGNGLAQSITGNAGINRLNGGGGNDTISGSTGLDTLIGGTGTDSLIGGADSDWYYVDHAADIIVEGAGGGTADRVLAAVNFTLAADDDIEQLTTTAFASVYAVNLTGNALAQSITGNAGVNSLNGGGGNDTISGSAGLDTLIGGTGTDSLIGGADSDWYYVDHAADIIVETAGGGTADRVLAAVNFTLAADDDIEQLTTTAFASVYAVNLTGNALAQSVSGNAGVNSLNGGGGNDTLFGGAGADNFVFNTTLGAGNIDRITDFSAVDDTVQLDDAAFAGLIGGALAVGQFVSNLTGVASDTFQRIIQDFDSGALFFDADGSNVGAAVQFATITPNVTLTLADFFVI